METLLGFCELLSFCIKIQLLTAIDKTAWNWDNQMRPSISTLTFHDFDDWALQQKLLQSRGATPETTLWNTVR